MGSTPLKGTYSASRCAAVLGLNQYQTPVGAFQVLMEENFPGFNKEKGYILPNPPNSAALRWGSAFENSIIELAQQEFNDQVKDREKLFVEEFGNIKLSCHVDGVFQNMDDGLILFEGKTTNSRAFYSIKDEKQRWSDVGSDMVPIEYQIQAAVQRICTGADLVRLSVLVFPKTAEDFEELGLTVEKSGHQETDYIINNNTGKTIPALEWATTFAEIGNFHTYNLPSNPTLENLIIEKIKKFDADYVKTKLPPKATEYGDIRRLLTNPLGTIIATEELKAMAVEYSEATRQLGASGPLAKRKELLKVQITDKMMSMRKDDWSSPEDKLVLLDPDGGVVLASFAKSGFRTKKAK